MQKTAYEMRISDWSSDVCSSDLGVHLDRQSPALILENSMTVAVEAGRHIAAAGLDTFYLDSGEGSPIVLIHGRGAGANSWGNWPAIIPRLTPQPRVFAFDLLGFCYTAKPNATFLYYQR